MDDLVVVQFVQKKDKRTQVFGFGHFREQRRHLFRSLQATHGRVRRFKLHSTGTLGPARTTGAYA